MRATSMIKKRGLGRGLDALLKGSHLVSETNIIDIQIEENSEYKKIPIEFLHPGKYQPRLDMNQESLQELAESIKSQGIIQPIIVRKLGENNSYEIIAGERRWRAAQLAQLSEVPVLIKNLSDEETVATALIENIQRADLNPIEEALSMRRLIDEFGLTHDSMASVIGKSRTTITNLLRILSLNEDVKILLEQKKIDLGHAKVLLATEGILQSTIAKQIAEKNLNVRATENLVKKLLNKNTTVKHATKRDSNISLLEQSISEAIGAKVFINHKSNGGGTLEIHYNSLLELDGIVEHIVGP
jgi:ParB family chromosome partitioning protein